MAIVTFMSDYGWKDHYVGAVKAALLSVNPSLTVVDISHNIESFDIAHGAYVLKNVFKDFPNNSVHLICIDPVGRAPSKLVALKMEEQYFVGYDSGIFSLLSSQIPTVVIHLNAIKPLSTTFPGKDILAPVAAQLASGKNIHDMGLALPEVEKLYSRQVKATKKEIVGNVIQVDKYGNLITNIEKKEFETILNINNQSPFQVHVGREVFDAFHQSYDQVESGDCFLLFNSSGVLQIGINKGNAAELLGLKLDTPISITFSI